MKYSFILPYYKRSKQFQNTLESFIYHYHDRQDFEILIIEDYKNFIEITEHKALVDIIKKYTSRMNISLHLSKNIDTYNPSSSFNQGALLSQGFFLIISNPECFHETNLLKGFDEEINRHGKNIYIICSCLAVQNIDIKHKELIYYEDEIMTNYCNGWLQHSIYNNRMLHFCTCISKENYLSINGFDENFKNGMAWEDVDFINTIKKSNMTLKLRDDLKVLHQRHNKEYQDKQLLDINARYYREKWA